MNIIDVSHHQPSNQINWEQAAKEVKLMIIRVQYGSKLIDKEYKKHVANCKKYNIPFAHYAYGMFENVEDAKVEAKDFLNRIDKEAKFLVLDTEGDTIKACGTANVAKASQAFIDVCKDAGYKTGFYVSHHLYNSHHLNKVRADFMWIPRYGDNNGKPSLKPNFPCELWQYTEKGKVSWYKGYLDLNQLNGSRSLDWFLNKGEVKVAEVKKEPTEPKLNETSQAHWDRACGNGYFDGTRPFDGLKRYEAAVLVNRIVDKVRLHIIDPLKARNAELEKQIKEFKNKN